MTCLLILLNWTKVYASQKIHCNSSQLPVDVERKSMWSIFILAFVNCPAPSLFSFRSSFENVYTFWTLFFFFRMASECESARAFYRIRNEKKERSNSEHFTIYSLPANWYTYFGCRFGLSPIPCRRHCITASWAHLFAECHICMYVCRCFFMLAFRLICHYHWFCVFNIVIWHLSNNKTLNI